MDFIYRLLISIALLVPGGLQDSLFPSYEGCTHEMDTSTPTCVSKVYCNRIVDIGWTENNVGSATCENTFYFNGYRLAETYYALKDSESSTILDGTVASSIVTTLDLSNNDYTRIPGLTTMQHLRTLNLSRNSLTIADLFNPYEVNALTEVDLSHNSISRIYVDKDYSIFETLKTIDLSYNNIVEIENGIFDSFPDLEKLDLSFNYIETINILTFEGVKNLISLNLQHNKLTGLSLALVRFSKLTKLDLSMNKIQIVKYSDFEKLTNLEKVDLSSNLISSIEANVFNKMTALKILNINNNFLDDLANDTFSNLTSLNNLHLTNNNLKSLHIELFKNTHISELNVAENKLEGAVVKGTFEGLHLIKELDLSNQKFTSIEDYAFYGLQNLKTLLLNNNKIQMLAKQSFSSLRTLQVLDLSNNQLMNIDIDAGDLVDLQSLLLYNNVLSKIKRDFFKGLNALQDLDLSVNNISQLETNSFKSLTNIVNFKISNNPVEGSILVSTFEGMYNLPVLDISNTKFTSINNGSFSGMNLMKEFNASHSNISEIEFNIFFDTGSIETIDLSYNKLKFFRINTTELVNLNNLILNNNLFTEISYMFLNNLRSLKRIIVSHNQIEVFDHKAFGNQKDLTYLDLSYNTNLKTNFSQIQEAKPLAILLLSGIQMNITFNNVKEIHITRLELSHSNICNITSIGLKKINGLEYLILNNNNITKIESSDFHGVQKLIDLDLSFNKITYIQPGAFKESTLIKSLNISHNMLKSVSYGLFRGLIHLETVDISYNEINDLQSERFHEVPSLGVLIADHNKINTVSAGEFSGTNLKKLSIGDNPIPCHVFVNLKKEEFSFVITAITLNEISDDENVDGVTCNVDRSEVRHRHDLDHIPNERIFTDVVDILRNISSKLSVEPLEQVTRNASKYLAKLSDQIEEIKMNTDYNSSINLQEKSYTNILLGKILETLRVNNQTSAKDIPILQEHEMNAKLMFLITKINQNLQDIDGAAKQYAIEMENRMTYERTILQNSNTSHEMYYKSADFQSRSFVFLEVCVCLILVIMIAVLLCKMYTSGLLARNRYSNRDRLSDAEENSRL